MKKFEVGERVALYAGDRWIGVIESIDVSGRLVVRITTGINNVPPFFVFPQQCRHLRKKERRTVWLMRVGNSSTTGDRWQQCDYLTPDAVKFVEARK